MNIGQESDSNKVTDLANQSTANLQALAISQPQIPIFPPSNWPEFNPLQLKLCGSYSNVSKR